MIINMGPQHPSTHGVLRLMLELDGETVLRTKPIIGYLHTGMEKTGEELTYLQGAHQRHPHGLRRRRCSTSWSSPSPSRSCSASRCPSGPRGSACSCASSTASARTCCSWPPTAWTSAPSSMMIYGWREREEVLRFLEKVTGLRMNHNYIRPGGVAADLPDGWRDDVLRLLDDPARRLDEYDVLLTGQPIWRERLQGVGVITAEEASPSAPPARSCAPPGTPGTCAATCPTSPTTRSTSTSIVGTYGDCFDRYAIRLNEIRESIRIVRQILDKMPEGDYRIQDKKVTPPPRARIDESMEALIHHFKIFTEGFKVPEGEVYVAVESPRGELGCYIVSDGSAEAVPHAHPGPELREPADPAAPDARRPHRRRRRRSSPRSTRSWARSTGDGPLHCRERDARAARSSPATRVAKSALIPLLHLAQEQDGYLADDAMEHIAELVGRHPGRGARHLLASTRCSSASRSASYLVNVCTNIACLLLGGEELLEHAEETLGVTAGRHHRRRRVHPRGRRVHRRLHRGAVPPGQLPLLPPASRTDDFDQLVDDLRAGALDDDDPAARHARPGSASTSRPTAGAGNVAAPEDAGRAGLDRPPRQPTPHGGHDAGSAVMADHRRAARSSPTPLRATTTRHTLDALPRHRRLRRAAQAALRQ